MQAIRFGDFTGVPYRIGSHDDPFEIYNIVSDPKQAKNFAADQPQLQKNMHEAVLRVRGPNAFAPRPYDKEAVPSMDVKTPPGIERMLFTEKTSWLARLDNLKADVIETNPTICAEKAHASESILFRGFIDITEEGAYTFYLPAAATALLHIHDATVIDATFKPYAGEASASVILAKRKHPFGLYWKNSDIPPSLEFSGAEIGQAAIPAGMLSH